MAAARKKGGKPKNTYRHGDLPNALVRAAIVHIETTKIPDFSIRELAVSLGVSHAAAYRHYRNKSAIFDAIALRGFIELNRQFEAAAQSGGEPLADIGRAYIRFGMENPGIYRVMFGVAFKAVLSEPLERESRRCFEMLMATIGQPDPETVKKALYAWSIVHGWVMLAIDGQSEGPLLQSGLSHTDVEEKFIELTAAILKGK